MKTLPNSCRLKVNFNRFKNRLLKRLIVTSILFIGFCEFSYAQNGNGNGNGNKPKDLIVRSCTTYIGNGLYSASFSYDNPTNQEINVAEDDSYVKYNNGNNKTKSLNKFKKGNVNKAFTKEFRSGGSVEWTVIQSNGKIHTVVSNANSSHCTGEEEGFIFPVYGQGNGKSEEIIGQELEALAAADAGDIPDPLIYQINNDKVLIEIVPVDGRMTNVISLLQSTFGLSFNPNPVIPDFIIDEVTLPTLEVIDVYFPIGSLLLLKTYTDDINFARTLYPPMGNAAGDGFTGNSVSQGDATQTSDVVRESFKLINGDQILPVDGTGITIGVMSNSFDTQPFTGDTKATVDVLSGDLPGAGNTHGYTSDVDVIKEYPFGVASDEGRAMMHIIHDVAPGAELAFYTGTLSPRNFEVGFNALALNSDLIVDDITFITEPFFGASRISAAIDAFTDANHKHFTSAGNFANTGYQGVFNPTTNQPINNNFLEDAARAHIFDSGTGDYLQEIAVKGGKTYMIVLQWDEFSASQDNSIGATADLDFYIVDNLGRLLVGNNRSNENGDSAEIMVFTATADGTANIIITSANEANVASNVAFRYIAFQSSGLTFNQFNAGSPTVSGHAMTEQSVTVGAIRFNEMDAEDFSSYGGILSDGTGVAVDFAAPDGVNTNVGSIGTDTYADGTAVDGDIFKNFFGTSAAAPSAAAAVALLQSALPTWYPQGYNDDVIQLFKDNAKGSVNPLQEGAGMIDVNKVFNSLASQTARITSFTIANNEDGTTPIASVETITINVIGDFFPPAPLEGEPNPVKFYLDGVELTATIKEDGSIEVTIPPFSGNPDLQVFTEPKDGSVNNGGFSDPYQFFQDGKFAITVTANPPDTVNEDASITQNPVTIKFGQDYKPKLTYTLQGVPEEGFPDNQTFEEVFPTVVFTTPVDNVAYPDANNYPVTPSFNSEPYDTEKYIVNFINGDLVIEKNNLTIKPDDQLRTYGADIANDLIYQITDADGIAISQTDLELMYTNIDDLYAVISAAHQLDFNPTYTSSLIFNDFKALINDWDWASETNDFKALINTWKALINTWKALINDVDDPTNGFDPNFNMILEGSSWTSTENTFKALINSTDNINLNPSHFTSYSAHLNDFKPLINDFKPLINDFKALINRSEFAGDIYLNDFKPLINDFKPLINDFKALINDSSALFTVVSTDDGPSVDSPDNTISKFYAVNLLTGIHVYEEPHYILPGSLINAIEANFKITYDPGRLTISPATLTAKTVDKVIEYGDALNSANLETVFTGLVNDDLLREVFSNTIPYYFVKLNENDEEIGAEIELSELKERGDYAIKIRTPQNYTIEYDNDTDHGTLTIAKAALTVNTTIALNINYGGTPEITTDITGFAPDEDVSTVFPIGDGGISYFFMKLGETPDCDTCTKYYLPYIEGADKMDVGVYDIFITDDPTDNYTIEFAVDRGTLTVETATLTINTTAFEIAYGGSVSENLVTTISGYKNGDIETDVFPAGILYKFIKGTEAPLDIADVKALGTYTIEVEAPALSNYVIGYDPGHGDLTIGEASLTFTTVSVTIVYGETPSIEPNFTGFAPDEDATVLEDTDGNIPYYFMKDGETFTMIDPTDLNVGLYDVFITDDNTDNYKFSDTNLGTLEIGKADLYVTISPDHLIINQGDIPQLTTVITGYVFGETEINVFPGGLSYYFVDEDGYEQSTANAGLLIIKIEDPENYVIIYNNDASLLINPDDVSKIQTFADCVVYDPSATDGLFYTVTYRYENSNDDTVYVLEGADNKLSGPAQYDGQLPIAFLPGSGTFEIRFNGKKLVWSLTTDGSTHKSSVSSANQSGTGECAGKLDGSYSIGPNPVSGDLNITQNIIEVSTANVYNMYGALVINGPNFNGTFETKTIDMSILVDGLYIVRIVSDTDVRTYNIIKQ